MQRIFVEKEKIDNEIKIVGEDVKHIQNVLRYKIGDALEIVVDGKVYNAQITNMTSDEIYCSITNVLENTEEDKIHLHIIQGLPKADKMELIIQKTIELGANEITPLEMERCVVKLDDLTVRKKVERWQKIAKSAAEQSKRNCIPKVNDIVNLKKMLELLRDYDIVIVAYEEEKQNTLKEELEKLKNMDKANYKIACIIGPEGGITAKEIEILTQNNVKCVTLGKRILRTETAPIALASIIMYEMENYFVGGKNEKTRNR